MLSNETQQLVANFILEACNYEVKLETMRQQLATIPEFEPYSTFQRIDSKGKGYIKNEDIAYFMIQNSIDATLDEYNYFIFLYSSQKNGSLSYTDYLKFILPLNHPTLRSEACNRQNYTIKENQKLSLDIETGLALLIQYEIDLYRKLEGLREVIAIKSDFNLTEAFGCIDAKNKGYINEEAIYWFLKKWGIDAEQNGIMLFIKKYDRDFDGVISLLEFSYSIIPSEATHKIVIEPIKVPILKKPAELAPKLPNKEEHKINKVSKYTYMKQLLLSAFESIIKSEHKLESLRIDLSLQSDFSIDRIYNEFSPDCYSNILPGSIISCFHKFGSDITDDDLNLFLRKYNGKQITLTQIASIFTPMQKEYSKLMAKQKSTAKSFSPQTVALISKILYGVIIAERDLQLMRLKLQPYDLLECFALCDTTSTGKIKEKEV